MSDSGRLGRRRRGRTRPRPVLALVILGLGLAGLPLVLRPAPRLVYNVSASAPIGLYLVRPARMVARGDLLLVKTPDTVRALAADRNYLPASVPLVKRVAAIAGDRVCVTNHMVSVESAGPVRQLLADHDGRPLPQWVGCRRLGEDEIFLLMVDVADSFDSRYFGPVSRGAVVGRLVPVWAR